MSYDDTCEYWTEPGHWFIWELLSAIFYCCLIASLTFGIMGLWNARRVLGTGQQLCGAPLSASTMYNANVYLSGGNLFMSIMNIIVLTTRSGPRAWVVDARRAAASRRRSSRCGVHRRCAAAQRAAARARGAPTAVRVTQPARPRCGSPRA